MSAFRHLSVHPLYTMRVTSLVTVALAVTVQAASALTWGKTDYLFVFGDSYTTTGYNISAGINSPTPGWVRYTPRTISISDCPADIEQRVELGPIPG